MFYLIIDFVLSIYISSLRYILVINILYNIFILYYFQPEGTCSIPGTEINFYSATVVEWVEMYGSKHGIHVRFSKVAHGCFALVTSGLCAI